MRKSQKYQCSCLRKIRDPSRIDWKPQIKAIPVAHQTPIICHLPDLWNYQNVSGSVLWSDHRCMLHIKCAHIYRFHRVEYKSQHTRRAIITCVCELCMFENPRHSYDLRWLANCMGRDFLFDLAALWLRECISRPAIELTKVIIWQHSYCWKLLCCLKDFNWLSTYIMKILRVYAEECAKDRCEIEWIISFCVISFKCKWKISSQSLNATQCNRRNMFDWPLHCLTLTHTLHSKQ